MQLTITVNGANPEEIARGLAAACAVFDRAGITPERAADARFAAEGSDISGFIDKISDDDLALGGVWDDADEAALRACCDGWEDARKPTSANLELVDPYRRPRDFSPL